MNKEFIPYQQAKALKALGFNEYCFATIDQTEYVHIKGTKYPVRGAMCYDEIDVPLWKTAFDWFRKEHRMKFNIQEDPWNNYCTVMVLYNEEYRCIGSFPNYEMAELELLKHLIDVISMY